MINMIYLTNGCCENAHGDEGYFRQMGLKFGGINDERKMVTVKPDQPMPEGYEFYPLTATEADYIAEDYFDVPHGGSRLSYSVLYKGFKWLAPQVEFYFGEDGELTKDEAKKLADDTAERIRLSIACIGGHILITDDEGDRYTVVALVGFDFATMMSWQRYKDWLTHVFKEPWQHTKDDWFKFGTIYTTANVEGHRYSAVPFEGSRAIRPRTDHLHKFHIKEAIKKGLPVPAEVLADYPGIDK